ncbi:MAG: T9SS type A sorting domain-containing protein [Salinivirgaceae bacterium]|nr:T9SS type A sorting domain-containing protein [Salinivirgaceae bacterium]
MKNFLLSIFTIVIAFCFKGYSQEINFVEIWAKYGDSAPNWFTDGSEVEQGDNSFGGVERGIVYSDYSGHVYVSSRHAEDTDSDGTLDQGEPHVYILDPMTGEAPAFGPSKLLTANITSADQYFGGGYPLNNVTCTEDGSIFACNMTLASGPDIIGETGGVTVKAFRVYRWSWEQDVPQCIIDYKEGSYRLGDKFSVVGNWETQAYIYAAPGESNKLLRWSVTAGVVASVPEVITLQDVTQAGTSITVAAVPDKADWIYVSGKGFLPTLFNTAGVNLTQVGITAAGLPSSVIAGRIVKFDNKLYMGMFSGDQSAFVFNISKHGENVTDADIIGFTPTFGTRYDNAYGEGAVEFGKIDNQLYVYVCAPSNGIACYRIDGLVSLKERMVTKDFQLSAFPNPANDYTQVSFTLPGDARGAVSVKVFDITGRFMGITAGKAQGGEQVMEINTSNLAPGTYMYQVVYGNRIGIEKFIVK